MKLFLLLPVSASILIGCGADGDILTQICGNGTCDPNETCDSCASDCTSCVTPPMCGDGACETGEDCASCEGDCGACPASCGDASCDPGEDCTSCATDCGACPASCGDASCDPGEDCMNCAGDCGACPASCGDASCDPGEDCMSCNMDCGACPASCGDGTCDAGEDCLSCNMDCGACPPGCGDGTCDPGENRSDCPADCGVCSSSCGNSICDADETCRSCPRDCGVCGTCGDTVCAADETCETCALDCICLPNQPLYAAIFWLGTDPTPSTGLDLVYSSTIAHVCDGTLNIRGHARTWLITNELVGTPETIEPVAALPFDLVLPPTLVPPIERRLDLALMPSWIDPSTFVPGSGYLAQAAVFVFADGNGNGIFDRGQPDNVPDRIVSGAGVHGNGRTVVNYFDGTPWQGNAIGDPQIRTYPEVPLGLTHSRWLFGPNGWEVTTSSASIAIPMQFGGAPAYDTMTALQCETALEFSCEDGWLPPEGGYYCPPPTNLREYSYEAWTTTNPEYYATCTLESHYGYACIDRALPPPADWPCP